MKTLKIGVTTAALLLGIATGPFVADAAEVAPASRWVTYKPGFAGFNWSSEDIASAATRPRGSRVPLQVRAPHHCRAWSFHVEVRYAGRVYKGKAIYKTPIGKRIDKSVKPMLVAEQVRIPRNGYFLRLGLTLKPGAKAGTMRIVVDKCTPIDYRADRYLGAAPDNM